MTRSLPPISPHRAREIVARLDQLHLVVVGDLMLDRYLLGEVDRISPEAPVPVVNVTEELSVPGGAANVAANVAALGASCRLLGAIGQDDAGQALCEVLAAHELPTNEIVVIPGRVTTTKTRILARGQQVVRIDREVTTPLAGQHREVLMSSAQEALRTAHALILEDYDKGVLDPDLIGRLITAAKARGIPIVVDPKIKHFFAYAGATVFKPNRRELDQAFANRPGEIGEDRTAARDQLRVDHLLVTLGAEGMDLTSAGEATSRVAGMAREVFDVSGAGDTVTAWVAASLAAGATMAEAAWLGNLAASIKVGKRGTATVSSAEMLREIDQSQQ